MSDIIKYMICDKTMMVFLKNKYGDIDICDIEFNRDYPYNSNKNLITIKLIQFILSKSYDSDNIKKIIQKIDDVFKNSEVYTNITIDNDQLIIEVGTKFYQISCTYKLILNDNGEVYLGFFFEKGTYGKSFGTISYIFINTIDEYNEIIEPLLQKYNKDILMCKEDNDFIETWIERLKE